jgi:uncharacterized damage-inducible protein DinB
MFTSEALRDIHRRCHLSLEKLLEHCGSLTNDQINQELDGFGAPTIRMQQHHMLTAQRYWVGVIHGRIDVEEDEPKYPTIESLEKLRKEIFELTDLYLKQASVEDLNKARPMKQWQGKVSELVPAHIIIMRTQTHIFQHQGQVTAMCRLLGNPVPRGMDYSLA